MILPWELVQYVLAYVPSAERAFLVFGGEYRLTRWPSLQRLQYVELGGLELPSLVPFPPLLRALVLHDNGSAVGGLCPHAGVQLLCLGSLPLYCHPDFTAVNTGVPDLAGFPQLRRLHLSAMGLDDDDGVRLAAALPPHVHTLHLDRNDLRSSAAAIVRTACARGKLRHLELGYNPLGQRHVEALLRALAAAPQQPDLRYLGLGCLGWTEEPALTALCCALLPRFAPHLEDLVLECNRLALASVARFACLVLDGELPHLQHLDLGDNLPTRVQTVGLAAQLTHLSTLCLWSGF
jgi:hypothetical protein